MKTQQIKLKILTPSVPRISHSRKVRLEKQTRVPLVLEPHSGEGAQSDFKSKFSSENTFGVSNLPMYKVMLSVGNPWALLFYYQWWWRWNFLLVSLSDCAKHTNSNLIRSFTCPFNKHQLNTLYVHEPKTLPYQPSPLGVHNPEEGH